MKPIRYIVKHIMVCLMSVQILLQESPSSYQGTVSPGPLEYHFLIWVCALLNNPVTQLDPRRLKVASHGQSHCLCFLTIHVY